MTSSWPHKSKRDVAVVDSTPFDTVVFERFIDSRAAVVIRRLAEARALQIHNLLLREVRWASDM